MIVLLHENLIQLAGDITLPLHLMSYHQVHHTAMLRAFGGSVIAQNDSIAGRLATQFGLASVTLDGKITRPGSMQVPALKLLQA